MATQTSKKQRLAHESALAQPGPTRSDLLSPALSFLNPIIPTPFSAIQNLFNHLSQNPTTATSLNDVYSHRGIFKTAATENPTCDQKLTIDLSPSRVTRIPPSLQAELAAHGLDDILTFFNTIANHHIPQIITSLSAIAGRDLAPLHANSNLNFRLIDYTPSTASPESQNG